jgi:predicted RecB family nuclease
MDDVQPRSTPGATAGHHFSSLQTCPHKAWSDYFLSGRLKADPPGFLLAMQREGIAHEEAICQSLFPGAVRIPERISSEDRQRRTVDAMRAGSPAILQAYLAAEGRVGIADVLELVGPSSESPTGFLYRVGEFKRAQKLMVAHVLQAAWYTELLGEIQGQTPTEAFFILGDGSQITVPLTESSSIFFAQKSQLDALRDPAARPGPHLCKACLSCPWRSVCIPELIATEHVSLLPGISRTMAERLRSHCGVTRWPELAAASDEQFLDYGIPSRDWPLIRAAALQLRTGQAVTRQPLNHVTLRALSAMAIEFRSGASGAAGAPPPPQAAWLENDGTGPTRIEIAPDWTADLSPVAGRTPIVVYGATELAITHRLLRTATGQSPHVVDLLALIENFVHAPLQGLELAQVTEYTNPALTCPADGPSRVMAMRAVINWLAGERGVAA